MLCSFINVCSGEDDINRVRRGSSKSMRVRSGRGARCVLPLGGYQRVNLKKGFESRWELNLEEGVVEFVRFVVSIFRRQTRPLSRRIQQRNSNPK